jgi:DNA-binding NtrC family response regulator
MQGSRDLDCETNNGGDASLHSFLGMTAVIRSEPMRR